MVSLVCNIIGNECLGQAPLYLRTSSWKCSILSMLRRILPLLALTDICNMADAKCEHHITQNTYLYIITVIYIGKRHAKPLSLSERQAGRTGVPVVPAPPRLSPGVLRGNNGRLKQPLQIAPFKHYIYSKFTCLHLIHYYQNQGGYF